ncbi:hypothetical protein PVAND_003262 [Polypedilum vanderplanki]|uniref:Cytochrome P450 n=1 Tax=Polypedilum vanderplanki TaxID=319348 RepID=A0A9J6BUL0_POLVA|nr:hypothetical protein PVAND_003262 [Polypedilum vanderplanki]
MSFLVIYSIFCGFFYFLYIKFRPNVEFFKKRKILYESPTAFCGNLNELAMRKLSFCDIVQMLYKKFDNERIFGFFNFTQPQIIIRDPQIIQQITTTHFDNFINRTESFHDGILNHTLPAQKNQHWRDMRNAVSPIFNAKNVKSLFDLMLENSESFVDYCKNLHNDDDELIIDVKDLSQKFTINSIASCVFGSPSDCLRKNEKIYRIATNLKSKLKFFKHQLYKIFKISLIDSTLRSFLQQKVIDEIKLRQLKNISRADVIQLLLHAKEGQLHHQEINSYDKSDATQLNYAETIEFDVNPKRPKQTTWSDDDFIAQGLIFFTQGHENTTNFITMLIYELAKNFDVQMELMDEIDEVNESLNGRKISHEFLYKMKFLDCVVSEALRLWPPMSTTNRICNENCEIQIDEGHKIAFDKGDQLIIPIYAIHCDEKFFENPKVFNPHRFDDENRVKIHSNSFMPFGNGKRSCIASRYVLQEAKLLIFNLLSQFTLEMCSTTPSNIELNESFEFDVKETIFIRLRARN